MLNNHLCSRHSIKRHSGVPGQFALGALRALEPDGCVLLDHNLTCYRSSPTSCPFSNAPIHCNLTGHSFRCIIAVKGQRRNARLDFSAAENCTRLISDWWPASEQLLLSLSAAQCSQLHLAHKQIALASLQIDSIQAQAITCALHHHPTQRQQQSAP